MNLNQTASISVQVDLYLFYVPARKCRNDNNVMVRGKQLNLSVKQTLHQLQNEFNLDDYELTMVLRGNSACSHESTFALIISKDQTLLLPEPFKWKTNNVFTLSTYCQKHLGICPVSTPLPHRNKHHDDLTRMLYIESGKYAYVFVKDRCQLSVIVTINIKDNDIDPKTIKSFLKELVKQNGFIYYKHEPPHIIQFFMPVTMKIKQSLFESKKRERAFLETLNILAQRWLVEGLL